MPLSLAPYVCVCVCTHTYTYMDQKVHHLPMFWAGVWHGKPIGNVCINTRCVTLLCGYLQHTVRMPACLAGIVCVCVCAHLPPSPPSLGGLEVCVCVRVRTCVTPGAFWWLTMTVCFPKQPGEANKKICPHWQLVCLVVCTCVMHIMCALRALRCDECPHRACGKQCACFHRWAYRLVMVMTEESFTKTGYGEVGLTVACACRILFCARATCSVTY